MGLRNRILRIVRSALILGAAFMAAACTSTHLVLPRADVEVSGRWVGTWRGVGVMDEARQDTVHLDLVQDGGRGRGRMVWASTIGALLPETVKLAGPLGVPVEFAVTGATVVLRHERGARQLAVQLHVDGDDMIGQVVNAGVPASLRLTREVSLAGPTMRERLGLLELDLGRDRARAAALTTRVDGLSTRVDGVKTVADDASSTARQAVTAAEESTAKATEAVVRLEALAQNGHQNGVLASPTAAARRQTRSIVRTMDVRFAFDRSELDDGAETTLLDVVDLLKGNPTLLAELEGYTDEIGGRDYNVGLSQRRVETVQRYLAQRGVPLAQIHLVGLGALNGGAEKRTANRRVTVKLMTELE